MSEDKSGNAMSAGSSAQNAPRLRSGAEYSAWAPSMDVFLQRAGAESIHKKAAARESWVMASSRVALWADEEMARALQLALDDGAGSSSGSSNGNTAVAPQSDEMKAARRVVSQMVERSRKVYGHIFAALPEELRAQVETALPQGWAAGLWRWLEDKFQSTEEDRVGDLLAQWIGLRQTDELFDAYAARVDKLKMLLESAKETQSERMYGYMLLDRLLPPYKPAVLALKASGSVKEAVTNKSWEKVKAFINTHERDEQRLDGASGSENKVMGIREKERFHRATSATPLSEVQCFNCKKFGHYRSACGEPKRSRPAGDRPPTDANPPTAPTRNGAGGGGGGMAKSLIVVESAVSDSVGTVVVTGPGVENDDAGPQLTYAALSNTVTEIPSQSDSGLKVAEFVPLQPVSDSESASVLGGTPSGRVASAATLSKALSTTAWGVDSMASMHVSGNRGLFRWLRKVDAVEVEVADGNRVMAQYSGTVDLKLQAADGKIVRITMKDVYFHERFSANLLSWGTLRRQGWQLHSSEHGTYTITPAGEKIIVSTKGRVSIFETAPSSHCEERVFSASRRKLSDAPALLHLHERMGHMSFDKMITILQAGTTRDIGTLSMSDIVLKEARRLVHECKACVQGKGHRTPFGHDGLDRGSAPGEVLHMDTFFVRYTHCGDSRVEYGLTMVDPYTGHRWFRRCLTKDLVANAVIEVIRIAQTQLGCVVKRLNADGGSEFINETVLSFCKKGGIETHFPPARNQELNGVAERSVRTGKDCGRTMLLGSGLGENYWYRAAAHDTFVWNRTHIGAATGVTPFEAMRKVKPSLRHVGVFGCDAFCLVPKGQRTAYQPKMVPCVYLGHDHVQNSAIVWVLAQRKSICTRDVAYRTSSFVNARALAAGQDAVGKLLEDGCEAAPQGGMVPSSIDDLDKLEREWDVERIIGRRTVDGKIEYQVQWAGYDDPTWEPEENVANSKDLVDEFEAGIDSKGMPPPLA
jgi:transposase InsO family protein